MGHYSHLYIDNFNIAWKYHVPSFLAFLFSEEDFFEIKEVEDEDEYYFNYGYKTNVQNSLEILDKNGYTKELFVEVYNFFYDELFLVYEEVVKEEIAEKFYDYKKVKDDLDQENSKLFKFFKNLEGEINEEEIENKFEHYINSFAELSREEEVQDFIKLLSVLLNTDKNSEQTYIELNDGKKYEIKGKIKSKGYRGGHFIDFEQLHVYLLDKFLEFPPWILIISNLFEEHYFMEYPEIISIMYIRILLEISENDKEVRLELDDIIQEKEYAEKIHPELENILINKINLYNKFFNNLLENEEHIREKYINCAQENYFRNAIRYRINTKKEKY